MFGYTDDCYRLKDSDSLRGELKVPFKFPTIEEIRTDLDNGFDIQLDPNEFILSNTGYVLEFVSV